MKISDKTKIDYEITSSGARSRSGTSLLNNKKVKAEMKKTSDVFRQNPKNRRHKMPLTAKDLKIGHNYRINDEDRTVATVVEKHDDTEVVIFQEVHGSPVWSAKYFAIPDLVERELLSL